MFDLLKKNVRVLAVAGAGVCGLVAVGAYQLSSEGENALIAFVGIAGAGAAAVVGAFVTSKLGKKDEAPKP